MSVEKHKLQGELPIAVTPSNPAAEAVRDRRFTRRVAASCIAITVGFVWLASHTSHRGFQQELDSEFGHGSDHGPLRGKKAEEVFLSVPNTASAIAASRLFATKPHLAGSAGDLVTAKDFLSVLQTNLGIEVPAEEPVFPAGSSESRDSILKIAELDGPKAWIDTYYPVLNTPLDRSLEILGDDGKPVWQADLEEFSDDTDPEAAAFYKSVPTFHGLSKDGDVTGQLIDANYGLKEDFDALVAKGVNFTGKIVLARYFGNFRGLKIKGAQELGAVGVLIYSDPHDDGSVTAENGYAAYPYGPARNLDSVQRGSVQFLSMYPGDPTTPGVPAYENVTRTDGVNIPSIPSLPISWNNAKVLLQEIAEGGANRAVKLVNHVDTKVTPIWNTMAVIPGHIRDEVIVVGNHRDAWVMGASDPSSGTASIHEVIRGFGVLIKQGWKPLRTILIASWDAEEYGLVGSTEWGEDFEDFIKNNVIAYVNLDGSVSGSQYKAEASPSLAHLIRSTAEDIAHPTAFNRTLWDARKDHGTYFGNLGQEEIDKLLEAENESSDGLGVGTLGSGSDFTVFLQRIGIASLQMGFSGTASDPVYHYHSVFDSERWMEVYGDPGFTRHVAVAKHLGLQTLRLADSIILPINTTHYAYELESYLNKVKEVALSSSADYNVNFSPLRKSIQVLQAASVRLDREKAHAEHELKYLLIKWRHKQAIRRKAWKAWCKIRKALGKDCHTHKHEHKHKHEKCELGGAERVLMQLEREGEVVDFSPRVGRMAGWTREQKEERRHAHHHRHPHHPHHPHKGPKDAEFSRAIERVRAVNKKLSTFEQGFISEAGIKDREWYRHLGVAPGKWLGYGATTFPALTEAFTIEKNGTLAEYETERLKSLIDGIVKGL